MEELIALVPHELKRSISKSAPADLPSTCSSLHDFLRPLPQFQRVVRELTDPELGLCKKSKAAALEHKRRGNECFSNGDFRQALSLYTQALRYAPMDECDMDKGMIGGIYVNRAASLYNLSLFNECIKDCNRAIVLSPCYSKAWYRRGKALVSLGDYEDAMYNLNIALGIESSPSGKKHINDEIKLTSNLRDSQCENSSSEILSKLCPKFDDCVEIKLHILTTPEKGRGMNSLADIPPASLLHSEEPFAAVIFKNYRETHCHFCFSELPLDPLPCSSCTTPLYCSTHCRDEAGGKHNMNNQLYFNNCEKLPEDVKRYFLHYILDRKEMDDHAAKIPQHRHECGGAHWAFVLPPEITLTGRILVKCIEEGRYSVKSCQHVLPEEIMDLSHNYGLMSGESKMQLHIYAITLTYCLQQYYAFEFPCVGASFSQLVLLICQVKINSMAIVHMRSQDAFEHKRLGKPSATQYSFTSNVQQVKVGQALYITGSMFNHSCQPNIHAYFLFRKLLIRSTEFVQAGYPLELSYGPQVGEWDHKDRQLLLEAQYSFKCRCSGCSVLHFSDLIIHAFRCEKTNCSGVIFTTDNLPLLELPLPVGKDKRELVYKAAQVIKGTNRSGDVSPGTCLACGLHCNLDLKREEAQKALIILTRLQDAKVSNYLSPKILSDAMVSLKLLRSAMHAFSKDVAQAEDSLAEALCLVGKFQAAMHHCKASIEILQLLYKSNHIIIGHELIKLASIHLSLNDHASALNVIDKLRAIFSLYYGSHVDHLFPYIENLSAKASQLAQLHIV